MKKYLDVLITLFLYGSTLKSLDTYIHNAEGVFANFCYVLKLNSKCAEVYYFRKLVLEKNFTKVIFTKQRVC